LTRKITPVLAVALAAMVGPAVRADTVDVSSITLLTAGEQTRGGAPLQAPELVTVVPAYEILNIAARNVTNPIANDLHIVVSTWASYELADPRWDNGTSSNLTGDVLTGYISGRLLDDVLMLRLGREHVMTGVGRMIQLDGGEAIVSYPVGPLGLRVSGYAGVPVSQRFATRSGVQSWNPVAGDLAYGGRAMFSFAPGGGVSGRGLDLGASLNFVEDGGDEVRQEVGADLRATASRNLTVSAFGAFSLLDDRFSEASTALTWSALPKLHLTADWRYTAPDLFLSRNSILSVFSASRRNDLGAGVTYELTREIDVGASYHLSIEPGEESGDDEYLGNNVDAEIAWRRGKTAAGLEVMFLDSLENGYLGGRLFGRQDFGRFFAAADVLGHLFREEVNGEDFAVTGTLSAGVELVKGFSAVVAGRAGMTPFLEQSFDLMAKLVYNQSYRIREVR
jgi:hypothetical protein